MNAGSEKVSEGLGRPAGSGVWGHTEAEGGSGVVGSVKAGLTEAVGVTGIGTIAGKFFGDVVVTSTLSCFDVLLNSDSSDCAEEFDLAGATKAPPGTVMVFGEDGALHASVRAYDRRVAGVVSGAADTGRASCLAAIPRGRRGFKWRCSARSIAWSMRGLVPSKWATSSPLPTCLDMRWRRVTRRARSGR